MAGPSVAEIGSHQPGERGGVVVTGVSTGIGAATARLLAERGFHVFGSVRREADGAELARALGPRFTPIVLDVTNETSLARAAGEVGVALGQDRLVGLVNNAGVAIAGPLALQPMDEIRRQFEVNVFGLLAATRAFLPLLGAEPGRAGPPGRIVAMSSVGGRIAAPFIGAYAGTKHAVEGLAESLRRELLLFGVDVVVVAPGAVATPIWDKAEAAGMERYLGTPYEGALRRFQDNALKLGRGGFPPDRVAETVLEALTSPKPRARYPVVKGAFANWTLPRLLPVRVVDRLIGGQLGLRPR
ncbi:MAG: SDR family NAD(P)-dependent oxidoreductase [Methylobacteriaceae bacterium]|nr:SDR family NAD(P)-dependent oxidoreductase [Methylobacteriaceae bacterium]